jgi:methylated-DNA-[protein]-cysteine S-methyltransferase
MNKSEYIKLLNSNTNLTLFQKKVLKTVMEIPRGEVRTYKWVAERVGSRGYRAVGTALKKNPYAPEVPCHRVISSDGSIGGYSGPGGVKGKMKLLHEEGAIIKTKELILDAGY